MTEPSTLLWLTVAYENLAQVDDYIDRISSLPSSHRFGFAICDNSSASGETRHRGRDDVTFVARPDNPGYLEGALLGLEAWSSRTGRMPDWIALSNTDLEILTGNPLDVLDSLAHDPVVVAPRITEGDERIEKNPHLLTQRTLRRLRTNMAVTRYLPGTLAYQTLSLLKVKASRWARRSRRNGDDWSTRYPSGTTFYSPYGALIFFSGSFFDAGGLPRNIPLLAEEYFIAEAASDLSADVVYRPEIHAHHSANVTTGPKITRHRARRTSLAFKAIYKDAQRRAGHR